MTCTRCGSGAINPHIHGRDETRLDLCDVCFWRGRAERLQVIIDDLPKYTDGKLFSEYQAADGTTGWAAWRYPDEARNVSRCHRPEDPDEYNTVFCWIIDDCDDVCDLLGVYSTREAAEKARQT